MILKDWIPKFNFHEEIMRVIPLWVRFPNLPLYYWGPKTLSNIGSMIRVPLFADECTTIKMRVAFARLLIEVDVTKELPKSFILKIIQEIPLSNQCIMTGFLPFVRNARMHDMIVLRKFLNDLLGINQSRSLRNG